MKYFKKLFLVPALCLVTQIASAANIKDYPTVAVMNFGNKAITSSGLREHDFSSATEYAIYQLSACGWFDLVDYEQLSTIAKLHAVNMSGLVDPGTVVAIGKFAGAQFMVIGNVTGLTTKENVFGYQHGNRGGIENAQHVVTANVALRIVDIETGRIIVAGLGKGSSTSTMTELHFKKYRNNKIETEDLSDTVTTDKKREYSKNKTKNSNSSYSKSNSTTKSNNSNVLQKDEEKSSLENAINHTVDRANTISDTTTIKGSEEEKNTTSTTNNTITQNGLKGHGLGDVNDDGVVDGKDVDALRYWLVDNNDDGISEGNADLDGNGTVTTTDLQKLKNLLVQQSSGEMGRVNEEISIEDISSTDKDKQNSTEQVKSNSISTTETDSQGSTETKSATSTKENSQSQNEESVSSDNQSQDSSSSEEENINLADNENRVQSSNKSIYYERETLDYAVRIGTVEVSDIQVRNAISKAVRDAIYGNTGIMTTLNNGKKLKIKTGF